MKQFMILHYGFKKPTPEQMGEWMKWFKSIEKRQIDQGGFSGGREISAKGTKDLPWGKNCITGYNVIEAKNLDAAERIAAKVPFVSSVRVYELRSH
jgi:hypothetical protein